MGLPKASEIWKFLGMGWFGLFSQKKSLSRHLGNCGFEKCVFPNFIQVSYLFASGVRGFGLFYFLKFFRLFVGICS